MFIHLAFISAALAACPPNCFSCDADDRCLGPDGRSWVNTGTYERFCRDGFYNSVCSATCPPKCAHAYCSGSGYCMATPTRTPGSDYSSAGTNDRAIFCQDGFYGSGCQGSCPVKCAQPYCSASGYCMATPTRTPGSDYASAGTNDRAIFCRDGYYGSSCQSSCPVNCAENFCSASGYCMATSIRTAGSDYASAGANDRAIFCQDGFFLSSCQYTCPENCVQPYCSASGYCMATPIRTPGSDYASAGANARATFCNDGYYGSSCGPICPKNCANNWCSASGYCMACASQVSLGDYASAGANDRAHFCQDGFFGSTCSSQCPPNCAQVWCSASGYCMAEAERVPKGDYSSAGANDPAIFCRGGFYGSTCANACPAACAGGCSASGYCNIVPSPTPVNPYPRLSCPKATPVPSACTSDVSQCSWYTTCLQHSTPDACPDIAGVMQEKCSEYQQLESSLSPAGQQWSKNVRSCLQTQLGKLWKSGFGLVSCAQIDAEFFDNHLPCYLNGPISFCSISTLDSIKVMLHASSILVSSHWWSALSSGAQLEARCAASYFQVNVFNQLATSRRMLADVETDLREFFQARFGPQGWAPDFTTINSTALALGFLPSSASPSVLVPQFVADALVAWTRTPAGAPYAVSINDGPPLSSTAFKAPK